MYKYRSQARNLAWYDTDGEPSSHNPFKRVRRHRRKSSSVELENALTTRRTDGAARLSEEQRRRSEMNGGLGGPRHADTFSAEPSSFDGPARPLSNDQSEAADPSTRSTEPINMSSSAEAGQPRKRKGFLGKFHRHTETDESLSKTDSRKSNGDKPRFTVGGQLKATIFSSWINLLLVCAPVGIALNYVKVNPIAVFVVNFIAIIPLAGMLSYATEEIALRTGETLGGLLNATFGNAVELIVAIIALIANEVVIVQTSLIGSMLSNLLLVMGMCFFFGGVNRLEQHFNPVVAQTAASLLALAVSSLIIPTAYKSWSTGDKHGVTPLSRGTAVILLFVYGCYLFFQLKSHAEIYNAPSQKSEKRRVRVSEGDASRGIAQIGKGLAAHAGESAQQNVLHDPSDEAEQPQLSLWVAVLTLGISTAFVAVCAEYMVNSINALVMMGGISRTFVGLILLPIVGNAAEHATAVTVACKDKMDLAIGVAVGSSMQIALLVLPLIIVIGWGMGNPAMTLDFDPFQVILLFVAVLLVNYLIADGKSHWLEGVLLQTMYLIIAVAAWFYPSHAKAA